MRVIVRCTFSCIAFYPFARAHVICGYVSHSCTYFIEGEYANAYMEFEGEDDDDDDEEDAFSGE